MSAVDLAAVSGAEIDEDEPSEDFRSLSVFPTTDDLYEREPFIRAAKITEPYDSVDHYLDVQFRLLREDFLSPLRKGLNEYVDGGQRYRNNDLRIYKNVKLSVPALINRNKRVGINVYFGVLKNVRWRDSKRFMHGGLLLLSSDNFSTVIFATVVDRVESELSKGFVLIEPIEDTIITPQMYKKNYVMLESKIFFEPYKCVLNALKLMSDDQFPMKNYLAYASNSKNLPEYFKGFNIFEDEKTPWMKRRKRSLDESQFRAYKHALTEEFALIQGPPGTGKTFIALEIVRTLLACKKLWKEYGPIVVVCYTNHALDQFLEGILTHTKSIVRIGDRSKSEKLKPFFLREKRRSFNAERKRNHDARREMSNVKEDLTKTMLKLAELNHDLNFLTYRIAVVPLDLLMKYCYDPTLYRIQSNEELIRWLFEEDLSLDLSVFETDVKVDNSPDNADELSEDDNQIYADDDLDVEFEFIVPENYKLIFPVSMIDHKIAKVSQEINFEYENLLHPEHPYSIDQQNRIHQLTMYREKLIAKRLFLLQQFDCHPIHKKHYSKSQSYRWRLYWDWVQESHDKILNILSDLKTRHYEHQAKLNECNQYLDLEILEQHEVIGLTTTCAARLQTTLNALRAPILLVEEAAEILEAHIVCSMTKNCKHVILIGDHKQLRPKASDYELSREFQLNISLFERIVKIRGDVNQLTYQHRMRPEIAELITPSIYKTLYNHESVNEYPNIKGVEKNLYFIDHNHREENHNDDSWLNAHESKFLLAFASYLTKQGYESNEITILCTYTGQLFELRKEKGNYNNLENIYITTVDNYQGEENKIILLSLVRNNGEGNVGFLREENRVCVALSRAREGLFIMGNMSDLVVKNKIWPKLKKVLESQNAIGESIELRCQIHAEQITEVKNLIDFELCPGGGCYKICSAPLRCGHTCVARCHILDKEHERYKCQQKCMKFCPEEHPCSRKCWQDCGNCYVKVSCELDCGHTVLKECYIDKDKFLCNTKVTVISPDCKHEVTKKCSDPIDKSICSHDCETRLPCGHSCPKKCHVYNDPEHLQYRCLKECVNKNLDCEKDHKCQKRCYEKCVSCPIIVGKERSCGHFYKNVKCSDKIEEILCKKPCKRKLDCGHACRLQCLEICCNCQEKVKKKMSCGHEALMKCSENPDSFKCIEKCVKTLPCGHPCAGNCRDLCSTIPCEVKIKLEKPGLCGHNFSVPCHLKNNDSQSLLWLMNCDEPCPDFLNCGHKCKGTCGKCMQGRIHIACASPCSKILICGHRCDLLCREECQPCKRNCTHACSHGKCNYKCHEPCEPCKKKCKWGCKHRKCTNLCGEVCNVPPCEQPCTKKLSCSHRCLGFCGEPCPPVCRICNRDELFKISPNFEDFPDKRLILLDDCQHCIENEDFKELIATPSTEDSIKLRQICCPKCKNPVTKCVRLKNLSIIRPEDIFYVKSQINSYVESNQHKSKEVPYKPLWEKLIKSEISAEVPDIRNLIQNWKKRLSLKRSKKQAWCTQEVNTFHFHLKIIEFMLKELSEYLDYHKIDSLQFLKNQVAVIIKSISHLQNLSRQNIIEIKQEIKRICFWRSIQKECKLVPAKKEKFDPILKELSGIRKFTKDFEEKLEAEPELKYIIHSLLLRFMYEGKNINTTCWLKNLHTRQIKSQLNLTYKRPHDDDDVRKQERYTGGERSFRGGFARNRHPRNGFQNRWNKNWRQ